MHCPESSDTFTSDVADLPLAVFIAEDDKVAVASLTDLLVAQGGIEVVGTANSEMAAADWLLSHHGTDLLITDLLLLPGGSGFGLVKHARNLGACRQVVVFSSYVTAAIADKCRRLGADAVFHKSQIDELLAYVRQQRASVR